MNHPQYTFIRSRELPEIGGVLHELEHTNTGAKICWLQRPDDNKSFGIGFTTLPEDSTGVFHILEHSVLSGSDKYPVKEPFVELLKSSMNTFLNAMTFPDKTVYPFSTRNNKDFLNLLRIYLDAVFHPRIYSMPEIFYQEGWHYELDGEGNASYKGVVFNEMKGAYANADELMVEGIQGMLFPHNCYRFTAGGDPAVIPDLTYENFIDAHRRFYSPSNAYIFLDGDVDLDLVLNVLHNEYLAEYAPGTRIAPPAMEAGIQAGTKTIRYEVPAEDSLDGKYRMAWGNVIGTYADKETIVAMQVLARTLCSGNQSPLSRCILDKGLAEDVQMQVQDGTLQPWVLLEVRNCKAENLDTVRQVVTGEMERLANTGLNREQLLAQMANMEFKMRERDYGSMPRGLIFGLSVMETWIYGGDPIANLEVGDLFENLRRKAEEGYFEDLLRRMMLENAHTCHLIMEPSHTVGEERRQAEQARLNAESAAWTGEEKEMIRQRQVKLQAWQESQDTPEALAAIPRLSLSDISAEIEEIPTELTTIAGIPVLQHKIACGGIVYCNLYFDIADGSGKELSLLGFLCDLLGELPTANSSAEELMNRRRLLCGSLQFSPKIYTRNGRPDLCQRKLCVSFSALEGNLDSALELVTEILTQTRFENENTVLDILRQKKTNMIQHIVMAGHSFAMGRVAAQMSVAGVAEEYAGGYTAYRWLKEQEENWNWLQMKDILARMAAAVFCTARLTASITSNDPAAFTKTAEKLATLPLGRVSEEYVLTPWNKQKEGIAIPADICFAIKGGNVFDHGGVNSGILPLASRIIGLGYLWNSIRVQGGAYGAGLVARNSGLACCFSFRDPSGARSLGVYDGAADFLRQLCASGTDLTGFIIGAVSDDSPLLTPRMQGAVADSYYWSGVDRDLLARHRKELVEATAGQLSAVADFLGETITQGGCCVIGPQNQLEQCGLDTILAL